MYASSSEVEIYDILRFLSVCGDFARIEEKLVFRQQHLMKYHQLSMYKPKENKTNEISKIKIYTLDISCILRKE